jgi:hypothetical protein
MLVGELNGFDGGFATCTSANPLGTAAATGVTPALSPVTRHDAATDTTAIPTNDRRMGSLLQPFEQPATMTLTTPGDDRDTVRSICKED